MKVPTGIMTFGSQPFSAWLKAHIDNSASFTWSDSCDQVHRLEAQVAAKKPRAVVVDLDNIAAAEAAVPGVEAQRGFKWTSVLFVFSNLDEGLVAFARSVRRRRWSLVGRDLIDQVGIDRVLAGVLTESGFIDSSIAAYETELYERSLEASEGSAEDEEAA